MGETDHFPLWSYPSPLCFKQHSCDEQPLTSGLEPHFTKQFTSSTSNHFVLAEWGLFVTRTILCYTLTSFLGS